MSVSNMSLQKYCSQGTVHDYAYVTEILKFQQIILNG
jgi:hypothetical protein